MLRRELRDVHAAALVLSRAAQASGRQLGPRAVRHCNYCVIAHGARLAVLQAWVPYVQCMHGEYDATLYKVWIRDTSHIRYDECRRTRRRSARGCSSISTIPYRPCNRLCCPCCSKPSRSTNRSSRNTPRCGVGAVGGTHACRSHWASTAVQCSCSRSSPPAIR